MLEGERENSFVPLPECGAFFQGPDKRLNRGMSEAAGVRACVCVCAREESISQLGSQEKVSPD